METLVIVYFSTNLNLRSVTALTFFWIVYSLIRTSFCVHMTHYIITATTSFEWNFHMLILLYKQLHLDIGWKQYNSSKTKDIYKYIYTLPLTLFVVVIAVSIKLRSILLRERNRLRTSSFIKLYKSLCVLNEDQTQKCTFWFISNFIFPVSFTFVLSFSCKNLLFIIG